ncbi:MAG: HipA domain-containing protein [Actinomycetota bacterium]|nr:HipA domain-containing protein [Actinomycetota bacterium]
MADEMAVFLAGTPVGKVSRTPGERYTFTYTDEYRRTGRVPLSPTLPIGTGPFKSHHIGAYLEGLLPEKDAVRQQWAAEMDTGDNAFDLLTGMGLDCVGAVQFVPTDQLVDLEIRLADYLLQTDDAIGNRLRGLRETGASWTLPDEHWSLPGAQDKFTLTWQDGAWHAHKSAGTSTHIIKPGVQRLHHQAALEHATMCVADRLGLRVAQTRLEDFDREPAIVVTRFDRITTVNGTIHRLHQVDFCQAMGRYPKNKYEERGGPRTRDLADMLRRESALSDEDVRRFSDAVLFNYVVGAPDGHSKNFALLYGPDGRARMAPLYDLSSAFAYDPTRNGYNLGKAAMSIGGRRKFGEVIGKTIDLHAEEMQLDPAERRERAAEMADAAPLLFIEELKGLGASGRELAQRLVPRLTAHAGEFAKRARTAKPVPTTPSSGRAVGQRRDAKGRYNREVHAHQEMFPRPPQDPAHGISR